MEDIKNMSLKPYIWAFPKIILYSLLKWGSIYVIMKILKEVAGMILWIHNKPALTSSDTYFLLRTWQGWFLLLLGAIVLVIYTVFDVHSLVYLSNDILHSKKISLRKIFTHSFKSIKYYRHPMTIPFLLYVTLLGPLAGASIGVSLTKNLYVPNFITSFIKTHLFYRIAYDSLLVLLFVLGAIYILSFHYMLIRKESINKALKDARQCMIENWKDFLKNYVLFIIISFIVLGLIVVGLAIFPLVMVYVFHASGKVLRFFKILFIITGYLSVQGWMIFFQVFHMMTLTKLYESYTVEDEGELVPPEEKLVKRMVVIIICIILGSMAVAYYMNDHFSYYFPKVNKAELIAHRGGGTLSFENSIDGIQQAIKKGANGTEVDVQRTKDGRYIINHDNTFERLTGVSKTPMEMNYSDIMNLKVHNEATYSNVTTQIPSVEEVLDVSKDQIHVYLELKGKSADKKMAEDMYKLVKQRGMLKEVTFLSLDYNLINTLEKNHPDASTGFLCYASFGNIEDLNCDMLVLEEESATKTNINTLHKAHKKVIVWTVNTYDGMKSFLNGNVDGVITDDVELGTNMKENLLSRGDFDRIFDKVTEYLDLRM